jgi:hypothetical protein
MANNKNRIDFILDFHVKDDAINRAEKQVAKIGNDLNRSLNTGGNANLPGYQKRLGLQSGSLTGLQDDLIADRAGIKSKLNSLERKRNSLLGQQAAGLDVGKKLDETNRKIKEAASNYDYLGNKLKGIVKVLKEIEKQENKILIAQSKGMPGKGGGVVSAIQNIGSLEARIKQGIATRNVDQNDLAQYSSLLGVLNNPAMRAKLRAQMSNDKGNFRDPLTNKFRGKLNQADYGVINGFLGRDADSMDLGHTRLLQAASGVRTANSNALRQNRYRSLLTGLHGRLGGLNTSNIGDFESRFNVYRAGAKASSDPAMVNTIKDLSDAIRQVKRQVATPSSERDLRRRNRYGAVIDTLHTNIGDIDNMSADELDKVSKRVKNSVKFGGLGNDINSSRRIDAIRDRVKFRRDTLRTGSKPIKHDLTSEFESFYTDADDNYFGGIRNMKQLRREQARLSNIRKFTNLADPDRNEKSIELASKFKDRQQEILEGIDARKQFKKTLIKDSALQTLGMTKYTVGAMLGGAVGGTAYAVQSAGQAEGQKLVLSGLVNTYGRFTGADGKQLGQLENFKASQQYSESLYKQLRKQAVESPLTTSQMFDFFMAGGPTLMGAGTKTKNAITVVDKMASLGKAMNLADRDIEQDIRATAMGDLRSTNKIGKLLGFNTKEVQSALAQDRANPEGQAFFKLFEEKIAAIDMALGKFKDSWTAIWSNFTDSIEQVAIKIGTKVIPKLKPAIENFSKLIDDWAESGKLDQFASSLGNALQSLGTVILNFSKAILPYISTVEGLLMTTFVGVLANFATRVAMQSQIMGVSVGGLLSVVGLLVGGIVMYKNKLEAESKSIYEGNKFKLDGGDLDAVDSLKSRGASFDLISKYLEGGKYDMSNEQKLNTLKGRNELTRDVADNLSYFDPNIKHSDDNAFMKVVKGSIDALSGGGLFRKDAAVAAQDKATPSKEELTKLFTGGTLGFVEKDLKREFKIEGDVLDWLDKNRGNKELISKFKTRAKDSMALAQQMLDGPTKTVPVGSTNPVTSTAAQRKDLSARYDSVLSTLSRNQKTLGYRFDVSAVDANLNGKNTKLEALGKLTASQLQAAGVTRDRDIALAQEQGLGSDTLARINQDYAATIEEITRKSKEQAREIELNILALREQNRQLKEQINLSRLANKTASAEFASNVADQMQGPGAISAKILAAKAVYGAKLAETSARFGSDITGAKFDLSTANDSWTSPRYSPTLPSRGGSNVLIDSVTGAVVGRNSNVIIDSNTGAVVGNSLSSKGLKYDSGKVKPEFKSALSAFLSAANKQGKGRIGIMGPDGDFGYRSSARQKEIFLEKLKKYEKPGALQAAIKKYGSFEKAIEAGAFKNTRKWVAPPGRSEHNWGLAADLTYNGKGLTSWAHNNAGKYGLQFRMDHEDWHVSLANQSGKGVSGNSKTLPAVTGTSTVPTTAVPTPTASILGSGDFNVGFNGDARRSPMGISNAEAKLANLFVQQEGAVNAVDNAFKDKMSGYRKEAVGNIINNASYGIQKYGILSNPTRGASAALEAALIDNQRAQDINTAKLNDATLKGSFGGMIGGIATDKKLKTEAIDIQNSITKLAMQFQYLSQVIGTTISELRTDTDVYMARKQRGLDNPYPYADEKFSNAFNDRMTDIDINYDKGSNKARNKALADYNAGRINKDEYESRLQQIDLTTEVYRGMAKKRTLSGMTPQAILDSKVLGANERGRDAVAMQLISNPNGTLSNPMAMAMGVYNEGFNILNKDALGKYFDKKTSKLDKDAIGKKLGGQIAGNFLGTWGVGQIMPNSNPESVSMGATLGTGLASAGMLGSVMAGPLGIVAAGIGGGLLGGLFGGSRPDPEEERRRQALEQHQKSVEDLLSSIDKGINIGNGYMRNVMTSGFYGNAGMWQSGRAYNRLAVQGYIGA